MLIIITAVMKSHFTAIFAVSGSPSQEESSTDTVPYQESFLRRPLDIFAASLVVHTVLSSYCLLNSKELIRIPNKFTVLTFTI